MSWSGLGLFLLATLFFWGVGAYNRLMRLRNAIGEAFYLLDRHLGERGSVCAKVTEALRPLVPSEAASFDALDKAQAEAEIAAQAARSKPYAGDPIGQLAVSGALHAAALARIMSMLDHHPELREQAGVDALVDELKLIERQRAFARQLFNQAVAKYNEAQSQFPTRVLAGLYGFAEARML
ncbi:MAG: LemA family protein [Paucibacter sp.]|nr:LemA family protein [Roseateles sp.]